MCKRNTGTRVDGVDTLGHVSIKIRPYAHAFRSLHHKRELRHHVSGFACHYRACCLVV